MAGIGFELRKVIARKTMGSFLQAAVSGIMIVAGPWLMTIVTITLLNQFMGSNLTENPDIFISTIIYSYAASLFIFGGSHYIFTRVIADYIYLKKEKEAAMFLVYFSIAVIFLSALIGIIGTALIKPGLQYSSMYIISAVILFVLINLMWILMIFISLLKWFIKILLIYAAGMGISLLSIYLLGKKYNISGALLGLTIGHAFIVTSLFILAFIAYKPAPTKFWKPFLFYLKKYKLLFLTGLFYYFSLWIDKFIYWIILGQPVNGSYYLLFPHYDIAVYFANLTIIPGMVYFVAQAETTFYIYLRKFLISLQRSRYVEIQKRKYKLMSIAKSEIANQTFLQATITISLILTAGLFIQYIAKGMPVFIFQTALVGAFFHLLFLTFMNFLFYLEMYGKSLISTLIFLTGNIAATLISITVLKGEGAGIGYALSAAAGSIYAGSVLFKAIRHADRTILIRNS